MRRAQIENLLPAIFRRAASEGNGVMGALLDAMEALHARSDDVLRNLDAFFDPRRAPDGFVPFLAFWVDLDRFFDESFRGRGRAAQSHEPISAGTGRLRELIHRAAYLSKWRGTEIGLEMFLETATGLSGFDVVQEVPGDDGQPRAFHIRVRVPEAARDHEALIARIVAAEKPAYVTFEIEFFSSGGH